MMAQEQVTLWGSSGSSLLPLGKLNRDSKGCEWLSTYGNEKFETATCARSLVPHFHIIACSLKLALVDKWGPECSGNDFLNNHRPLPYDFAWELRNGIVSFHAGTRKRVVLLGRRKKNPKRTKCGNLIYCRYKRNELKYILIHLSICTEPQSSLLFLTLLSPVSL